MSRQRKWGSEAERLAAYRSRQTVQPEAETVRIGEQQPVRIEKPGFVHFRHQPHVSLAVFNGYGRGMVRRGPDGRQYVLVARHDGPDLGELGIVTADDWHARLGQQCEHGHVGWACHTC
jgi:hypothetical protein